MLVMPSRLIIFSFDTLESASSAREALRRDGFAAHRLHLRTIEDEAGPVEGNFLIGDVCATISRAAHLLEVQVADSEESALACECAQRHGGCDVHARNSRAGRAEAY
jgi:hypothetical protein